MNLKKNKIELFIIIFFFIFILLKLDLLKKTYIILNFKNTNDLYFANIIKNYDLCESSGVGYVFFIKKNYNLNLVPEIISFNKAPGYYWIFNSQKFTNQEYKIILFNLDQNNQDRFNFKNYKIIHNYKNDCLFIKRK